MRRATSISIAFVFLIGCADDFDAPHGPGPAIRSIHPEPAIPGGTLTIDGFGFGAGADGIVALGGRGLTVSSWSPEQIVAQVPDDAIGGVRTLAVSIEGRRRASIQVVVQSDRPRLDASRRFPPSTSRDAAPVGRPDAGPPPRDAEILDGATALQVRFTVDPAGRRQVRLAERPAPAGELHLEVHLPDEIATPPWGLAFHLVWDRNLLEFIGPDVSTDDRYQVAGLAGGRLALGRVDVTGLRPAAVLRFAVRGRGEARIEFPIRYRTLRGSDNHPIRDVTWATGSVRVEDVTP